MKTVKTELFAKVSGSDPSSLGSPKAATQRNGTTECGRSNRQSKQPDHHPLSTQPRRNGFSTLLGFWTPFDAWMAFGPQNMQALKFLKMPLKRRYFNFFKFLRRKKNTPCLLALSGAGEPSVSSVSSAASTPSGLSASVSRPRCSCRRASAAYTPPCASSSSGGRPAPGDLDSPSQGVARREARHFSTGLDRHRKFPAGVGNVGRTLPRPHGGYPDPGRLHRG